MTIWFTSDTHYGHANIIKYSKRPYSNVREMDEGLILNYNSVVQPGDTVYHLGDVGFHRDHEDMVKILQRLNGNKVLVMGNHDKKMHPSVKRCFASTHPYLEIDVEDSDVGRQKVILFHYACRVWNKSHRGAWALYGHSHGSLPDDPNSLSFDVGVDCHNYYPISYSQAKARMAKKKFVPVDHHGE